MSVRRPGVSRVQWVLFATLYALQGIVIAYFFNFNQAYLRAAGLSKAVTSTVQSIALIPLVLRFLGGPLSDRVNLLGLGHRRPYIVLGLLLQGCGLIGLTLLHPRTHLIAFTTLAVVTVIGLALYDTATDGFILDVTTNETRPRFQGMLMAIRFLGATLTSVGFGCWLDVTGNGPGLGDGVYWTCAGLGLVPLVLVLFSTERPRNPAEGFRWEAFEVLLRRRSLVLLLFGTLYAMAAYGVEINLTPFYRDLGRPRGFSETAVGLCSAARYIGRAAGAALLGLAAQRLGAGACWWWASCCWPRAWPVRRW